MSLRSDQGKMSVNRLISIICWIVSSRSILHVRIELQPSYERRDFLIFLEQQIRQKPMYTVHVLKNAVL